MSYKGVLLIQAVIKEDIETVNTLLNQGVNVNEKNNGKSALFIAVEKGCYKIAQQLIKFGAYLDSSCNSGPKFGYCTAVHIAVDGRHKAILNLLLNSGANVNAKNDYGDTPLHCAVSIEFEKTCGDQREYLMADCIEIIEMLLSNGADICATNTIRQTVLHLASQNGLVELVEFLLQYEVDIDALDTTGSTPLLCIFPNNCMLYNMISNSGVDEEVPVSGNSRKKIAELLITKGADIEARNIDKETVLHLATKNECREVVELLLQYDANVNAKDRTGSTPLHCILFSSNHERECIGIHVCDTKCKEIAKILINKGADVKATNNDQETVLHKVVRIHCMEVFELLLQYDIDVNVSDRWGNTILHSLFLNLGDMRLKLTDNEVRFSEILHIGIIKLLINKGSNIHAINHKLETPLHLACKTGFVKTVKLLLQYNADVNARDSEGLSPLHCTFCFRRKNKIRNEIMSKEITELLINKGADVTAKSRDKRTALHFASAVGCVNSMKVLLLCRRNVDDKDESQRTALHYAAATGNEEVLELLLDCDAYVNATDNNDLTPLHYAFMYHNIEAVVVLLERRADINWKMFNKMTMLQSISMFGFDENKDLAYIITSHVVKLITLKCYVSEENFEVLESSEKISNIYNQCEEEIKCMKSFINDTNITFFDIFIKDLHILTKYINNENICHLLESDEVNGRFPIYFNSVNRKLYQAKKRNDLLIKCNKIFKIFSDKLPYDIFENILTYLTNRDLENMFSAFHVNFNS